MRTIAGFGALNLDLIFGMEDLNSIRMERVPLKPGKEVFLKNTFNLSAFSLCHGRSKP